LPTRDLLPFARPGSPTGGMSRICMAKSDCPAWFVCGEQKKRQGQMVQGSNPGAQPSVTRLAQKQKYMPCPCWRMAGRPGGAYLPCGRRLAGPAPSPSAASPAWCLGSHIMDMQIMK
jgi:hypothetical protein